MGKDLKGKKLPAGICQRKDGLYSARFTSKTGRRVEKFFKKSSEAKKVAGGCKVRGQAQQYRCIFPDDSGFVV